MVPCKEHGKVMVSQKGDFVRPFFLSDKNLIAAGGVNANLSFKGSDVGVFGVLNFKRTSPSSPRRAPQDDADGAALEAKWPTEGRTWAKFYAGDRGFGAGRHGASSGE